MAVKTAGTTYVCNVPEGLVIPEGATHLWVYNRDNAARYCTIPIPAHDAAPSTATLFTFAVLSDIHVAEAKTVQQSNLANALSYIKNSTQCSAIVTAGDNVDNGADSSWDTF